MIKVSLTGVHDSNITGAVGTVTVDGGDLRLKASSSISEATFLNGRLFNDLSLSLQKPSSFNIEYDVPRKDVKFQFMNSVRVMGRPLSVTYTHWKRDNRTALDGTLVIDEANKFSASYGLDRANCKVKYSYTHKGLITVEPSYDSADNSWDFSVLRRVYENDLVRASYQSSSKVLGVEWMRNYTTNTTFKISASLNLTEESKIPTVRAESTLNFDV